MLFNKFYEFYKQIYPDHILPSPDFLCWFIGFIEGDGSFTISKRGDLQLVLTQSDKDLKILHYVQTQLGFGHIYKQSVRQKVSRFVVQDNLNLYLLCLLFNGNMCFPTRQAKFHTFVCKLNEKIVLGKLKKKPQSLITPISLIYSLKPVNLNDSWLAGFSDSEGCFTISFLKNSKHAYRVRYILSQKWDANKPILDRLLVLFNSSSLKPVGSVVTHSNPLANVYELHINGVKNQKAVYSYFDRFPLKSKKFKSYTLYKEILQSISEGKHLTDSGRDFLYTQSKLINT